MRTSYIRRDDNDVCFVIDQHAQLDFCSASSLKRVHRYTCCCTPTHYPDSEPTSLCSYSLMLLLNGEVANINFVIFGFTRLEPTIYCT